MNQQTFLLPRSLDEPVSLSSGDTPFHDTVPGPEAVEWRWAEVKADLLTICSPLDLSRAIAYCFHGTSYEEIALLEGVSVTQLDKEKNKIKQSVYRVRKQIRRYLLG